MKIDATVEFSKNGNIQIIIPVKLQKTSQEPSKQLTNRERQVLEGIVGGKCNKEIAYGLHISERSAKFHVSNLLRKFDVPTRLDLRDRILGRSQEQPLEVVKKLSA